MNVFIVHYKYDLLKVISNYFFFYFTVILHLESYSVEQQEDNNGCNNQMWLSNTTIVQCIKKKERLIFG